MCGPDQLGGLREQGWDVVIAVVVDKVMINVDLVDGQAIA
jgi:hypothetical protein